MDILTTLFSSILSICVLFLSVKIIGNRQMSELNMFDYINGITIGSIAAEIATSLENNLLKPLVSMVVYTFFVYIISVITAKSIRMRRFFNGESLPLLVNGKLLPKSFQKAKVDLNEFLNQCRVQGYFNPDDIAFAYLEQNGKISILPKATARPATVKDVDMLLSKKPDRKAADIFPAETPYYSLIADGHILHKNLQMLGRDDQWLLRELAKKDVGNYKDVFFACCNGQGNFLVFKKNNDTENNDIFQ